MRLLSLNAWGGRLFEELIAYVTSVDADIVCLQEVLRSRLPGAEWLLYRGHDGDAQVRADLFDDFRRLLPNHDAYYCPSMCGELLDGEALRSTEFGLATFVRRSCSVIGQAMDFVHGAFLPGEWGPHPRPRNAHVFRLFCYQDGSIVSVAHVHGLRIDEGKSDNVQRSAQAVALVRLIKRLWRPGEKLIVCGDLNVLPESTTFEALAEFGLSELVTAHGFTDTRTSHYKKYPRYGDYVLVTPQIELSAFQVISAPEVSDHSPLLLDFS